MSATELTKTRAGVVWQGARRTWVNTASCEAGLDRLMAGAGGPERLTACRTGPGNMGVNSVLTHEKRETSRAREGGKGSPACGMLMKWGLQPTVVTVSARATR